jgi:D-psicose/D-tagatose/L-ribulose 3-epimerase
MSRDTRPIGLSTFLLASPFSDRDVHLFAGVREMGYSIVEVCIEEPAVLSASAVSKAANDEGLSVLICGAFGPERDVSAEDVHGRSLGIDYLRTCVEFAAAVGSPLVSGPMYAPTGQARLLSSELREQQWARACESLATVAEYASVVHVSLAIEALNRFETDMVNTVEQALRMCSDIGADNVGLLCDTFHMNIEEKLPAEAIRAAGHHLFHVQASENDRGTPGTGHVDWASIARALADIGYQGAVVVESFLPTVAEIARAVSMWRPVASSPDALARDALPFLERILAY